MPTPIKDGRVTATEVINATPPERRDNKPWLYLPNTDSVAVAMSIRSALLEKAATLQYPQFTEYVLQVSADIKTFLEKQDPSMCDCPLCEAKRYVAAKLNPAEESEPTPTKKVGFSHPGQYL